MLLLENGDEAKQITVEKFAEIMGIEPEMIKRIAKNPVFEINPQKTKPDRLNGGLIAPAGKGSKPYIFREIDGITHIIRYYESRVPDKVNPRISTYEPKRVVFEDQLSIYPKLDLALFMYSLPSCFDSPNHKPDWHYSFQNKEKKATATIDSSAKLSKALAYITNPSDKGGLTDGEILLIAKGIYAQNTASRVIPNPSSKNKTVTEIRADLITLVMRDADLFLDSADSDVTEFYGMVMDAVDRGIFSVRTSSNSNAKGWYWEKGPMKDKFICDIAGGQNDFDMLKSAIEADPNKYYQHLNSTIKQETGKQNLADFLKENKAQKATTAAPADTRQQSKADVKPKKIDTAPEKKQQIEYDFEEQDDINDDILPPNQNNDLDDAIDAEPQFELPKNYNELSAFVKNFNGGKFVQAVNKQVWDRVKDKIADETLTFEFLKQNIDEVLADNKA